MATRQTGEDRDDTTAGIVEQSRPGARAVRRALLCLLIVVVLLGAAGLLGVRTAAVGASADGWTLRLVYPQIARSGLDVRWQVTVTHTGGFDEDIVLAVSAGYLDIFETQGFHPEPDMETADDEFVYLTFTAPTAGDVFRVDYDAYIQPASQLGRSAQLRLLVADQPLLSLDYRTWLVP